MQKRFFTIAAVMFAGAVCCGQFEDISGNENVRHDLLLDYEYTTFFGHRSRNSKEMKPFLDMLNTKPGKNLTEKAVAFLKEEGLTEEDMNKIRNELIVKQK